MVHKGWFFLHKLLSLFAWLSHWIYETCEPWLNVETCIVKDSEEALVTEASWKADFSLCPHKTCSFHSVLIALDHAAALTPSLDFKFHYGVIKSVLQAGRTKWLQLIISALLPTHKATERLPLSVRTWTIDVLLSVCSHASTHIPPYIS